MPLPPVSYASAWHGRAEKAACGVGRKRPRHAADGGERVPTLTLGGHGKLGSSSWSHSAGLQTSAIGHSGCSMQIVPRQRDEARRDVPSHRDVGTATSWGVATGRGASTATPMMRVGRGGTSIGQTMTAPLATEGAAAEPLGCVCALIESRAREVGLAAIHRRSLEFDLTQFNDCGSYSRACAGILAAEPSVVVLSRTSRGTQLHKVLEETLRGAGYPPEIIAFAERRHFDETEGQALLEEADVVGLQPAEFGVKFVACAAFNALWCYVENTMECRLRASAARIVYRGAADIMVMDVGTVRLLELVADAKQHRERGSVFGLFNCRTAGGARLLRQSLLQPPATLSDVRTRQGAVEALLGDEELFYELQRLLPAISDMDLLAARLTAEPKTRGQQWCKAAVRTALRLRHALAALPQLADALEAVVNKSGSTLLSDVRSTLGNAKFPRLLEELDRVLDGDGPPPHHGSQGSMAHAALLYSVRTGVSALLDVSRQTWNDALEEIHTLHRSYAVKYLSHAAQAGAVPAEFIRTVQKGASNRNISTTRELNTENFKLRQAEREILTQTMAVLDGLFADLRSEASSLYRVSHASSQLDMVQAFVGYALLLGECARPELTEDPSAPIAVKAGRHPLMEKHQGPSGLSFEPFDFFVGEKSHFQTVTGPNGVGKSTYLQTLAQLVVLAQIGCFVPAKYAAIRLSSCLLTRIGSSDCVEANASTFMVEMQEAAHILRSSSALAVEDGANNASAAPRCLVLIDELGRGTSHADGLALCRAVCERLLQLRAYTLFATHFYDICRLQAHHTGLRNMHINCTVDEDSHRRLMVRHVVSLEELLAKAGVHYGIQAAAEARLPEALLKAANAFAAKIDARLRPSPAAVAAQALARRQDGSLAVPLTTPAAEEPSASTEPRADAGAGFSERSMGQEDAAALKTVRQLLGLGRSTMLTDAELADVVRRLQRPWLVHASSAVGGQQQLE
eukprot:TRINITY_DN24953_c0_g3_i2.p1 TRINITY_DN24953_c0_g3~~TRINITY_DN24953_c0_g3_i2.p1  ORF type:complete len:970 (-),score=195.95 TRINITY_DN24953_c0_g3_i2:81-2990(-)